MANSTVLNLVPQHALPALLNFETAHSTLARGGPSACGQRYHHGRAGHVGGPRIPDGSVHSCRRRLAAQVDNTVIFAKAVAKNTDAFGNGCEQREAEQCEAKEVWHRCCRQLAPVDLLDLCILTSASMMVNLSTRSTRFECSYKPAGLVVSAAWFRSRRSELASQTAVETGAD